MIDIRFILSVLLFDVCMSESVGQFSRYRIFNANVSHNISASTMMTTIVKCDRFYSSRSTRTIAYHATLQLCQLYEDNEFPVMILPPPSPPRTVYVKGTVYALVQTPMTWTIAQDNCEINGGQLVKIDSAEEHELVSSWLRLYGHNSNREVSAGGPWIGLNDRSTEGLFSWADGSSLGDFTMWVVNNPDNHGGNEDCVSLFIYESKYSWNDVPCFFELWSICEYN